MKTRRVVVGVAIPAAVVLGAPQALAGHFGSNGSGDDGVRLTPNKNYHVQGRALTTTASGNASDTVFTDYAPTNLVVQWSSGAASCTGDVCIYDSDYGDNGWLGLYDCDLGTSAGSHPNMTCSRGRVLLNQWSGLPSGVALSEYNICHELGHSVGLNHNSHNSSCVKRYVDGGRANTLSGHDVEEIDAHYK